MSKNIFGDVFCDPIIEYKCGCLYDGYINNKDGTHQNIVLVKEKLRPCRKHKLIPNEYIMKRIACQKVSVYHYVIYEQFDYNLTSFIESKYYSESSIINIVYEN